MKSNVKELYEEIGNFLLKEENDMGDLTVWLIESYIPSIKDFKSNTLKNYNNTIQEELIDSEETILVEEEVFKPKKKPIQPIKISKEQKLLDEGRTNLFAKRAGVDKIKFETIIKDIQGESGAPNDELSDSEESYTNNYNDDDLSDDGFFNESPLSNREMHQVAGLFESNNSQKTDFTEIEKLQKIEQLAMTGSIGVIKRSS